MFSDFAHRADDPELMDDLGQPEAEFAAAYRELKVINKMLGGVRAIRRFLPPASSDSGLLMLDVAAGACDVSEALISEARHPVRIVALDLNAKGLKLAENSWPVVGDALALPFKEETFDAVAASLFFHHLSTENCVRVLQQMWRITRRRVLVNDLHRHAVPYISIRTLTRLFSRSKMVRHDGPLSVRRAFLPSELLEIARRAGIPARVYRSFPYRLVLVAEK